MLKTVDGKGALSRRARKEIEMISEQWGDRPTPAIADIGANIGYYSTAFLNKFIKSNVYAYEIHPINLAYLKNIVNDRLIVNEYGLLDEDTNITVGTPSGKDSDNGCFSIYYTDNGTNVCFKNANNEKIRPDIVKIDVEGSESKILRCKDFFSNTKIVLIEFLKLDPFKQNELNIELLSTLGFMYKKNTSKNNQMWIRI